MNENLIEALNAYTTALEQKVSALEQRVAQLERLLAANTTCDQQNATLFEQLQAQVKKQEERIAQLEATPAPILTATEENEPEIEVELITEDDEESEPEAETAIEPEPTSEEIEEQTPDTEEEDTTETIAETTIAEPKETETAAAPKKETITEQQPIEIIKAEQPKIDEQPKANGIYGKTVKDIRMAISIGDRFLFQRELFDKNPELLQKTLTELNELNSFDEAMAYINSHFGWDKEQPAYELFINALHRRFGL